MHISNTLISACIRQDRKAQQQLYEQLLPYLRAVTNRYLRDTSWWKDVLQESFVKIFNHIDKFNPDIASIQHWAAKVVINTCINYNQRVIQEPSDEINPVLHDQLIAPDISRHFSDEHLLHLLKSLPDGYFEVFNLHVIDGFSHQEIGQMLGIQEALSRQRLNRAKNWLKSALYRYPKLIAELQLSNTYLN